MSTKKWFATAVLLLSCSLVFLLGTAAPSTICLPVQPVQDTLPRIYEAVEVEATFPGGIDGWVKFLETTLDASVPVRKGAPEGRYTVYIQFVVDKEGNISNIKALTNHGYGMEGEVIRILKKSPNWLPATQGGRKVKAYRKQPVTFVVIDENKKRKKRS
ncbi:MAG: energy transducer TonB [Chitinophagaceae bacterium]